MGEIIGGVIVVAAFIGFVLWKNRGRPKHRMTAADWYKEEWWGEQQGHEPGTGRADDGGRDDD